MKTLRKQELCILWSQKNALLHFCYYHILWGLCLMFPATIASHWVSVSCWWSSLGGARSSSRPTAIWCSIATILEKVLYGKLLALLKRLQFVLHAVLCNVRRWYCTVWTVGLLVGSMDWTSDSWSKAASGATWMILYIRHQQDKRKKTILNLVKTPREFDFCNKMSEWFYILVFEIIYCSLMSHN